MLIIIQFDWTGEELLIILPNTYSSPVICQCSVVCSYNYSSNPPNYLIKETLYILWFLLLISQCTLA